MKKLIATTSIATAGVAALTLAHGHDAQAAEYNGGYNPQDPTSYSYSYTIDNQGNYHFTWEGNWSPERFNGGNASASYYTGYDATAGSSYTQPTRTYSVPSYTTQTTSTSSSYSSRDYASSYTTTTTSTRSVSRGGSSANLYTVGQCTYYVFDRVGGTIGSTWGNASNWASAAAAAGYTVNNRPSAGAILQTTQGAFGHVAYVESVGSDGSIRVSEMNYGYGPGVVTSRTISASQAASYNYIH
ncbi:TPA: CHAP domain-containing protein [Staphylococcus pseudintermedius]|uniref:CHAP domain-containing protein n=1 Tax=Staphylococcus pseudintermedius TaxID=283734 RepID=UPI001A2E468E|nr:CHAP domain-containing protein [Staphylococcus pseudintermedius]ELW0044467.1 CHAP domain-containing protein [Staphylococcus pseudintermedius]MBJ8268589.1 CHAP domain-containing protein [Staphylococcus pseudintermedius]MDT0872976.1 CHAP domain-containing protein [Staphylococcus pseudintermedius]MDT0913149.1 CHAP domain-containing protein [Staphylococcus pseudintermedius]MDT0943916.1 CHAP domain-containing protein [Staphylococcus pseudintermedius]